MEFGNEKFAMYFDSVMYLGSRWYIIEKYEEEEREDGLVGYIAIAEDQELYEEEDEYDGYILYFEPSDLEHPVGDNDIDYQAYFRDELMDLAKGRK